MLTGGRELDLRDFGGGNASGMLHQRASSAPEKVAVVFEGEEITYGDLDRGVTTVAGALIGLGLRPGDAAATFMLNRPEFLLAALGGNRAGVAGVSVNAAYKGTFLAYVLEHSGARVLFVEGLLAPALMTCEMPACIETIVYVDGVPETVPQGHATAISWDEFISDVDPDAELPTILPSDTAGIIYTSGTTGRSKGVVSPALMGPTMAREIAVALETTSRDRLHTNLPLFHGAAYVASFLHSVYAGATLILSRSFSVSGFWQEIRDTGATQFNALGSILPMLLSAPPTEQDRDHAVTRVFAAPAPPDILYRFEERFGVHIVEGYGMTEIKNVIYNPRHGRKVGSMGKPTATSIVEVHDDHGRQVPPGVVGELVYRPRVANVMLKGYHRDAEATVANMRDLWWHTGDLGFVDDDGFFYYHDRKKDSMRRRGENISSVEVEAVLNAFPAVGESAAIGVRSELGEQEVMVLLEVADPDAFDLEAFYAHCDAGMPHFMVPRYFRVLPSLPRTPTGKIQKLPLREEGVTDDTWDATASGFKPTRHR